MIMKTTKLQLSLLALFLGCVSLQAQYKWANPLNQDIHVVRGQAWQSELKDSYARLPLRARDKVRKPLWDLAQQSAGLSVAFQCTGNKDSLCGERRTLYATHAGNRSFGCRLIRYGQQRTGTMVCRTILHG